MSTSEPSVSVLLPVFNGEKHLQECLDSVIQQDMGDWELVVVDDQSTDRTPEILLDAASFDSRIRTFRNPQKGLISALQLAFSKSNGTYLTRMDHDDLMPGHRLRVMRHAARSFGEGALVLGLVRYFSDVGDLGDGYQRYESWLNRLTSSGDNFTEIYKECSIPSPAWLTRRSDFLKAGAFDPLVYPEDYDLAFRFRQAKLQVVSVPEEVLLWRDHPTRGSRNALVYADNRFSELKVNYFQDDDYDATRELVLWGAGKRGKQLAKLLQEKGLTFRWWCNQQSKIGKEIYGVIMESSELLGSSANPQIIVAVAGPNDQTEIRKRLDQLTLKQGKDYFFFC